jgi:hypothetical protein
MDSDGQDTASVYGMIESVSDDAHARLLFHVNTGDYFAVLATVLGFVEESLVERTASRLEEKEVALVQKLRENLIYLHEHYRIEPKEGAEA